jgi:outer membrane protein OmpA-like peptidoglycan-associated protein
MKNIFLFLMLLSLMFASCKSTQNTAADNAGNVGSPMLTEPNPDDPLHTDYMAFSPNGDGIQDTIHVIPNLKDTENMTQYELRIMTADGKTVKRMSGELKNLKTYSWDGKDDNNTPLADGMYKAEITLTSASGESKVISSNYFNLDTTPPAVTLTLSPLPFSPDGDGNADVLNLDTTVNDASPVGSWNIKIRDEQNKLFYTLKGTDLPAQKTWNGYAADGTQVMPASMYSAELTVVDKAGNSASTKADLPIDLLIFKMGGKQKLLVRSITFATYKTSFNMIKIKEVHDTVRWLANLMKKNPSWNLIIEGHALNVYEKDPVKHQKEEDVLLPLSKRRAETIKTLLVAEGISADRITTQGMGSSEPIVPPSDSFNQWKNRRVEFIIVK